MENSTQLNIVVKAINEASGTLDEVSNQVGNVGSKAEETGAKTGVFSGLIGSMAGQFVIANVAMEVAQKGLELIKSTVTDGIKSYEVYQTNQAQIANALKTTGDASGQSVESLNKYADSLSSQTGISGNAINSAQLLLLNFKELGGKTFPSATKTVADLATVMSGGSTPSTQNMTAAANLLGKAMENPEKGVTALTRAHITLSQPQIDTIKAMQKAGDTAGAQKQLLSDLSDVVGGKAVTAHHTLAGEIEGMKSKMEALEITVGQKLVAAWHAIEPALASFFTEVEKVGGYIERIFKPLFEELGKVIKDDLIPVIEKHKQQIMDLLKVVGVLILAALAPLVAMIAASIIAWIAIIAVFSWLVNVITDVIHWFEHLWQTISKAVETAYDAVSSFIGGVIKFFNDLPGNILKAVEGFATLLLSAGEDLVKGLIKGLEGYVGKAVDAVKNVGKSIVNAAKDVLKIFSPSEVFSDIGQNVSLGMAQGIDKGAEAATTATVNMASGTIGAGSAAASSPSITNSSNATVTIQNVYLQSGDAVKEFFKTINQDGLLASKGLTVKQGAN